MSDEYLKQVEHRLNGRIDDMKDEFTDLKADLKDHMRGHRSVEKQVSDHAVDIAAIKAVIPELKDTMVGMGNSVDKLTDAVNTLMVGIARNDEQTKANTMGRIQGMQMMYSLLKFLAIMFVGYIFAIAAGKAPPPQ